VLSPLNTTKLNLQSNHFTQLEPTLNSLIQICSILHFTELPNKPSTHVKPIPSRFWSTYINNNSNTSKNLKNLFKLFSCSNIRDFPETDTSHKLLRNIFGLSPTRVVWNFNHLGEKILLKTIWMETESLALGTKIEIIISKGNSTSL
jgi:hypothetical protein